MIGYLKLSWLAVGSLYYCLLQSSIDWRVKMMGSFFIFLSTILRSPSPEPIYNSEGKRLNTREYRTRKKIEEERHSLITEMVGLNPDFKPPADYKYDFINHLSTNHLFGLSCLWLEPIHGNWETVLVVKWWWSWYEIRIPTISLF